jgi:hypothetical protein
MKKTGDATGWKNVDYDVFETVGKNHDWIETRRYLIWRVCPTRNVGRTW